MSYRPARRALSRSAAKKNCTRSFVPMERKSALPFSWSIEKASEGVLDHGADL